MNYKDLPNEKLADAIIAYRYLGLFKEEQENIMQELANRRANGDIFDFESYIENNLKTLPNYKPDTSIYKSIVQAFSQVKNLIKSTTPG